MAVVAAFGQLVGDEHDRVLGQREGRPARRSGRAGSSRTPASSPPNSAARSLRSRMVGSAGAGALPYPPAEIRAFVPCSRLARLVADVGA
ncbi:MAG: hypothetical protein ACRDZO_10960 [Egibacteraceae bacterium]